MSFPRIIKLDDGNADASARFLTGHHVLLVEGKKSSVVTLLRVGNFRHAEYGDFEVTHPLLNELVSNFNNDAYGQKIFIDVAHAANGGAAGEILKLFVEGARLRAQVAWTPYGIKAIREKQMIYLSAEYHENYPDNEAGETHGAVLLGAGLVNRPHIKRMDPITLGECDSNSCPILLHEGFADDLLNEAQKTMNKFLKALKEFLAKTTLGTDAQASMLKLFETNAKELGDDKKALGELQTQYEGMAGTLVKQLKDAGAKPDAAIAITLAEPQSKKPAVSVEDAVAKALNDRDAAAKQLAEDNNTTLTAKKKIFSDALDDADGLSDETKKSLSETGNKLISIHWSDEQVKEFGESQINLGNQMEASKQLSDIGYQVQGSPHIMVGAGQAPMQLQETINKHLANTSQANTKRLKLLAEDKVGGFVKQVMTLYDQIHGPRLLAENKMLAGEETSIGDTNLPGGVQRTVIREALSDLRILELVQTLTDPTATSTTQIPYEERDISAVQNHAITFEGKGIRGASVSQEMDLAYIIPKKLAMKLSNEVIHFTRASMVNWDAFARNVTSNARVMREMLAGLIANEIQRTSDSWNAGSVAGEDISARLDGTNSFVKTVQFPVVRPHQDYTLKGVVIGSVQNPITVDFNGTDVPAYDGSGDQVAGTYFNPVSLNLGYIGFVDEAGAPVTPTQATATISYDYSKNVVKWDSDVPAGTTNEKHLNTLLQAIGARKATMNQDRYVSAEYLLMSPTLNDSITNAEQFEESNQKNGSSLTGSGDLQTVKGLPSFGTNAPGIDLGDSRIHMGVRSTTSYVIAKPFMTGIPFEAVNASGQPTGEKVSYGEEYSAIHTPFSIRNRSTGIVVYSAIARAAA